LRGYKVDHLGQVQWHYQKVFYGMDILLYIYKNFDLIRSVV